MARAAKQPLSVDRQVESLRMIRCQSRQATCRSHKTQATAGIMSKRVGELHQQIHTLTVDQDQVGSERDALKIIAAEHQRVIGQLVLGSSTVDDGRASDY